MDNRYNQGPKDQAADAPMEQVRELLFGAQLKDMEVRFKRQEERLLREIHDVKDSLKKRLDSLENFMKSEVSSLLSRLRQEQEERDAAQKAEQRERIEALKAESRERTEAIRNEINERTEAQRKEEHERVEGLKSEERQRLEAVNQINTDIGNMTETFERKLTKLANTIDTAERDLRALLLTESGSLTDKIETKYSDALTVLAKTAAQIRSDMVYRSSLTSMFAEMVGGLSKPWNEENMGVHESPRQDDSPAHFSDDHDEYESELRQDEQQAENHDGEHHEYHENHEHHEHQEEMPPVMHIGSADNY
ncbi:hypothetical protein C4J81_01670 [Deltaproteobacteria bacterium Smac51]|nr:hypothetical protein C4J81_01670 [Deltaproteobacteria bacterium Smac51]